jgi:hypothetical protein
MARRARVALEGDREEQEGGEKDGAEVHRERLLLWSTGEHRTGAIRHRQFSAAPVPRRVAARSLTPAREVG